MQPVLEEQRFIDATINARLLEAWKMGEPWAATDYYGIPLSAETCNSYREQLLTVSMFASADSCHFCPGLLVRPRLLHLC